MERLTISPQSVTGTVASETEEREVEKLNLVREDESFMVRETREKKGLVWFGYTKMTATYPDGESCLCMESKSRTTVYSNIQD